MIKIAPLTLANSILARYEEHLGNKEQTYSANKDERQRQLMQPHFLLSNNAYHYGKYVPKILSYLEHFSKQETPLSSDENRCAFVVGNFYLLNLIDKIPYNTFLMCDDDPLVCEFLKAMQSKIIELSEINAPFAVKRERIIEFVKHWENYQPDLMQSLFDEQTSFRDFYFLSSEKRFSEIAKKLKTVEFVSININLQDLRQIKALREALQDTNSKIGLFYLTNLGEFCDPSKLSVNLDQLPQTANPYIFAINNASK
jgi:hypothetical protein